MSLNSYSLHDFLNIFNTFIFIKPFIKHNCNIRLLSKAFRLSAAIVQIIDKNTVRCGEETYEGDNLILCTGSESFIPPIPGVDSVDYWTHREALGNKELQKPPWSVPVSS